MKQSHIQDLQKQLSSLTYQDRKLIIEHIQNSYVNSKSFTNTESSQCPHCNSKSFVGFGSYNGRKRFKCKICDRTFTSSTGSTAHGIHNIDKFLKYIELMFSGTFYSLKSMCNLVEISNQTAFDWRHKILNSFSAAPGLFEGEVEMDDVFISYSRKGRKGISEPRLRGGLGKAGDNELQAKILFICGRDKKVDMSLLTMGRVSSNDLEKGISNRFTDNTLLYSDGHKSFTSYSKKNNIKHETFLSKHHKNGDAHVQNLNQLASRFKKIINYDFCGVSTKYLNSYLNWFKLTLLIKKKTDLGKLILDKVFVKQDCWNQFILTEKKFQNFIQTSSNLIYEKPTVDRWKSLNWV